MNMLSHKQQQPVLQRTVVLRKSRGRSLEQEQFLQQIMYHDGWLEAPEAPAQVFTPVVDFCCHCTCCFDVQFSSGVSSEQEVTAERRHFSSTG